MLKCAFWYRVLHGTEIVRNCYAWDADASKQINTKSQKIREIQYGMVFMPGNSKEIAASEVIFDSEFSEPPIVVCSIRSDTILTEYGRLLAFIGNDDITSKGFTVRVANDSDKFLQPVVTWIAVNKTQ